MIIRKFLVVSSLLTVSICIVVSQSNTQRATSPKQSSVRDPKCGTLNDVADRIETCAKPLMDIIQGTVPKWPRNNSDILDLCQSFGGSERCIREHGRRCTSGLQRTIISTLGSSIQRARKRECTESKLPMLLKTMKCVEDNRKILNDVVANASNYISVIELQMNDLDEKTNAVCCMVHDIETSIKSSLGPLCPTEVIVVQRVYRAVLEDVLDIICRQPKCNNVFKNYRIPQRNQYDRANLSQKRVRNKPLTSILLKSA